MDISYQGVWRMDWGFGNPNITAAFIVTLMVGIWILAFIHKHGFWLSVSIFTVLEICLIHTLSRGGVLGTISGCGILIWFLRRPWPKARLFSVLLAAFTGLFFSLYINAHTRFVQGFVQEDKSISNRILIWKKAPQMLADAPGGWGLNHAGDAYMAWYQDTDRYEFYGSLVNTHLTKIVEFGLLGGWVYLFLWILSFWICWPNESHRWVAVPLGVLCGFGVAACFTNMGRQPVVWIVPILAVLLTALFRVWKKSVPSYKWLGISEGIGLVVLSLTFIGGNSSDRAKMKVISDGVLLNGAESRNWLLVDTKILGNLYPKSWRTTCQKDSYLNKVNFAFAFRSQALPPKIDNLIVAGMFPREFISKIENLDQVNVLLLNPNFDPSLLNQFKKENIEVVAGEFSPSLSNPEWKNFAKFKVVEGAGDFLASWPVLIRDFLQRHEN